MVALIEGICSGLNFTVSSESVTFSATPSNGELIVISAVSKDQTQPPSTPSGFTALFAPTAAFESYEAIWYRVASSEPGATYSVAWASAAAEAVLYGARFSGVATGSPIDVNATAQNVNFGGTWPVITCPSATAVAGGLHVVWGHSDGSYTVGPSAPAGYTLATFTNDLATPRAGVAYKSVAAGATGSQSPGSSAGADFLLGSFVLKSNAIDNPTTAAGVAVLAGAGSSYQRDYRPVEQPYSHHGGPRPLSRSFQ